MTELAGRDARYAVGKPLGVGGMATVYRGRRIGKNSDPAAVKRLHPHLVADKSILARFRDEARIATRLVHPNVVAVVDVVEDEAGPALVLEYVDGASLMTLAYASWNMGEPIPPPVASAIVLDVLAALAAAHETKDDAGAPAPIVHRDVSPHNVLVGRDGTAKLSDFGIARIGREAGSTAHGHLKGKVCYMAPEQLGAQPADPRMDLYAAGVVLWELLASRRLFEGDVAEIVGRVLTAEREPPSAHAPETPPELDAIVLRAIDRDPGRRFGSARAMADALAGALPPAPRAEVARWVERCAKVDASTSDDGVAPPSSAAPTRYLTRTSSAPAAKRSRRALVAAAIALAGAGAVYAALQWTSLATVKTATPTEPAPAPPEPFGEPVDEVGPAPVASAVVSAPLDDRDQAPSAEPAPTRSVTAAPSLLPAAGKPFDDARARRLLDDAKKQAMATCGTGQTVAISMNVVTFFPHGKTTVQHAGGVESTCVRAVLGQVNVGPFNNDRWARNYTVSVTLMPRPAAPMHSVGRP